MLLDLEQSIVKLSKIRPIFHNERDFQLELAWLIKEENKDKQYRIRLEYCFDEDDMEDDKRSYVDIAVFDESRKECALIELKYKTLAETITDPNTGENYNLRNHSARDYGCYSVLSDLSRLEGKLGDLVAKYKVTQIYSCILTNDARYKNGFRNNSLFENFGLKNGVIKANNPIEFKLKGKKLEDTCAKDFHTITFKNEYKIEWKDPKYSDYLDCLILSKCL